MSASSAERITDVDNLAAAARERAAERGLPLTPAVYEVMYNYIAGGDATLIEAVDAATDLAAIERVHKAFFTSRALENGVNSISGKMVDEIDQLVATVDRDVASGGAYIGEVSSISASLANTDCAKTATAVAQRLVGVADAHVQEKRQLVQELSALRTQFDEMRTELNTLQSTAFVDHLTQVSNRRRLDAVLSDIIDAAKESGEPLCVAIADIDKFKSVNDNWGHAAGDKILQRFAELMKKNVRAHDTVARYGGEEFALVLPNTPLTAGCQIAERIREYFGSMRFVARDSGQRLGRVTVSFGVTALRTDDDEATIMRRADELLYAAKNGGRNNVKSSD